MPTLGELGLQAGLSSNGDASVAGPALREAHGLVVSGQFAPLNHNLLSSLRDRQRPEIVPVGL